MSELNQDRVLTGIQFQNNLYKNHIANCSGASMTKNGRSYNCGAMGKKVSDLELELTSRPDTRFIFETTKTLRHDRHCAKEAQAKLIKKALKKEKKDCVYLLVVPDDSFFPTKSKEPGNNNIFLKKINKNEYKRSGIGAIDIGIKESAMDGFVKYVDKHPELKTKDLIKGYKKENKL